MHIDSLFLMTFLSSIYIDKNEELSILDVGSYDVGGTYKNIFNKEKWSYTGADIEEGPNVDTVVDLGYKWSDIPSNTYDVVISGQCLEHVEAPWLWERAVERVLKPGGWCIVIAPWIHCYHAYPLDCWRIFPDGLRYLMTKWGSFSEVACDIFNEDTYFVGRKHPVSVTTDRTITGTIDCHKCLHAMKTNGEIWACPTCGEKIKVFDNWPVSVNKANALSAEEAIEVEKAITEGKCVRYSYEIHDKKYQQGTPKWVDVEVKHPVAKAAEL
jgi:SAM-dependent methyltransferase